MSGLLQLLAEKHSEDVFIPECNNGPASGGHYRMDAWAMDISWSHPTTYCYEIKTERRDFLQDRKWQNYLPLCSDFYFVCPHDLIQPSELPAEAGLYWGSQTGSRLWLKKKAPRRQIQIPDSLWRYLVMRMSSKIPKERAFWETWAEAKETSLELGRRVSHRLSKTISTEILLKAQENERLKAENQELQPVKQMLSDMGISRYVWDRPAVIKQQIENAAKALPDGFLDSIEGMERMCRAMRESLAPGRRH